MGTDVLKSFGTLQSELEQAKLSLRDVDENIKKIIGRDPSENQNRAGIKRTGTTQGDDNRNRNRGHNNSSFNNSRNKTNFENDEPVVKKRNVESNVFKRLSDRPVRNYEDSSDTHGKQVISKVIVTPKEMPTRQDVLAAQSADEKSKARNRRMFGALLGTLQKFRQEETKLKPKEEKRAQVEKKLEEQQIKEREEMKKERQDLFYSRKKKQAEIRMIELKMTRMKEQSEWEEKQKPLTNFIRTKAKPHIYYLPRILNDENKKLLGICKTNIEKMIDKKRQEVFDELSAIENRVKKNFDKHLNSTEDEKHDVDIDPEDHLHEDLEETNNHLNSTVVKEEVLIEQTDTEPIAQIEETKEEKIEVIIQEEIIENVNVKIEENKENDTEITEEKDEIIKNDDQQIPE